MKPCGILRDFCRNLDRAEEELGKLCGFLCNTCNRKKQKREERCYDEKHGYHRLEDCGCENRCDDLSESKCEFYD